ncbi:MAG: hypothetical protein KF894_34035, partial [Labilithrix sp.]|nr:hypothetical protein [Labilithrix sp.]
MFFVAEARIPVKKLLIALFVGVPLVGCTEKIIVKKAPAAASPEDSTGTEPEDSTDGTDPEGDPPGDDVTSSSKAPEDRCLDGQDMDGADVDVSSCPAIPSIPAEALMGKAKIGLGAWEIGTTADGETYKYGTLSSPNTNPRVLSYDGGSTEVNAENLE